MQHSRFFSIVLTLALILVGTGCETNLQQSTDDLSLMARNATEVLPPDAVFVSMMNMQEIQENQLINPFGPDGLFSEQAESESMARLRDFIDRTGFDPEDDLSEAYLAVSPKEGSEELVSIALYVNMERELLENYIDTELQDLFIGSTYNGIDLHVAREDESSFTFALVNDNMILAASERELVEDMIDRLNGESPALDSNSEMMKLVTMASAGESGWVAVQKPDDIVAPQGDDELDDTFNQLFMAVSSMAVLGNVESNRIEGQIMLIPDDRLSSDDLTSLVKGAIAAAKAVDQSEDLLALLDQVSVSDHNDHVRIRLEAENGLIQTIRGF